jgi:hypothetical protein
VTRRQYTREEFERIRQMARSATDASRDEWARRFPVAPLAGPVRVVLVGCVAEKAAERRPARDLYTSPLWRARRAYAEATAPERWLILSAAWGLIHPAEVIPPYDRRLDRESKAVRQAWADRAASCLIGFGYAPCSRLLVEVHAGEPYRADLVPILRQAGVEVLEPLAGLGIGEQLGWYRRRRIQQLELFRV